MLKLKLNLIGCFTKNSNTNMVTYEKYCALSVKTMTELLVDEYNGCSYSIGLDKQLN